MHLTLTLVVVNEIRSLIMIFITCPTRVRVHEGLDRGLGLNSGLACHFLLNFQARISALLPAIKHLRRETKLYRRREMYGERFYMVNFHIGKCL